jgi:hypothetical protein
MNLLVAHDDVLSVYNNQKQEWGTIKMPEPPSWNEMTRFAKIKTKNNARILQIF